ncbi:MAG: YihY/virulence factor BrkB family protein [Nitriliruptoraceae bacterium]|nr:YihY/virulence factor BrkB family protein [Nitriliruptoraceae bacterium]
MPDEPADTAPSATDRRPTLIDLREQSPADRAHRMDGASARRVRELPVGAWAAIAQRVKLQLTELHLSLLAAGVAFRLLLATIPAAIAAISIWGLAADPEVLVEQIEAIASQLPESGGALVSEQLSNLTDQAATSLSTAMVVSLVAALWAASSGMLGLVDGCAAAYGEARTRSFVARRLLGLAMTLAGLLLGALTVLGSVLLPRIVEASALEGTAATLAVGARWPVMAALSALAIAVVYRVGPDRRAPRMRWIWLGALIATSMWLVGSGAFSLYVSRIGDLDETYGSLAGVVIVMLWVFLSAFAMLFGALCNAEVERQTLTDTTTRADRPTGARDAAMADAVPADYDAQALDAAARPHP